MDEKISNFNTKSIKLQKELREKNINFTVTANGLIILQEEVND